MKSRLVFTLNFWHYWHLNILEKEKTVLDFEWLLTKQHKEKFQMSFQDFSYIYPVILKSLILWVPKKVVSGICNLLSNSHFSLTPWIGLSFYLLLGIISSQIAQSYQDWTGKKIQPALKLRVERRGEDLSIFIGTF